MRLRPPRFFWGDLPNAKPLSYNLLQCGGSVPWPGRAANLGAHMRITLRTAAHAAVPLFAAACSSRGPAPDPTPRVLARLKPNPGHSLDCNFLLDRSSTRFMTGR